MDKEKSAEIKLSDLGYAFRVLEQGLATHRFTEDGLLPIPLEEAVQMRREELKEALKRDRENIEFKAHVLRQKEAMKYAAPMAVLESMGMILCAGLCLCVMLILIFCR